MADETPVALPTITVPDPNAQIVMTMTAGWWQQILGLCMQAPVPAMTTVPLMFPIQKALAEKGFNV